MPSVLEQFPKALQELFITEAQEISDELGFIERERDILPATFATIVVLTWIASPNATYEDIASSLEVSVQALQQKLNEKAQEFFKKLIARALEKCIKQRKPRIPLLACFSAILAEDCTSISLPDSLADLFPGCGGTDNAGAAAVKIHVVYDLLSGRIYAMDIHTGRTNDTTTTPPALPEGGLRLADLGFFDRDRFRSDIAKGGCFLSRIPTGMKISEDGTNFMEISRFLQKQRGDTVDVEVTLGELEPGQEPFRCRLVASRCSEEVANRRKQKTRETAKKKGRAVSERQLVMCEWTVLVTNLPREKMNVRQLMEIYWSRWQIELLFKRAKSLCGLNLGNKRRSGARLMCELYAKILGLLLVNWGTLVRFGPLEGYSTFEAVKKVQQWSRDLMRCLLEGGDLEAVVERLHAQLSRIRRRKNNTRKNTRKSLLCSTLNA